MMRCTSLSAMQRYGGSNRTDLRRLMPPKLIPSDKDDQHTYGLGNRPPTPIKAVIGNFYGEVAGF